MMGPRSHSSPSLGLRHGAVQSDGAFSDGDDYEDASDSENENQEQQQQDQLKEVEEEDDDKDESDEGYSLRTSQFDKSSRLRAGSGASSSSSRATSPFTMKPRDMWKRYNLGLYASYAAVGLLSGMVGNPSEDACEKKGYFAYGRLKEGDQQLQDLCDNLYSITLLPWNFKLVLAIVCDLVWPFGLRRKPYMVIGWLCVLIGLFVVGLNLQSLTHEQYLYSMLSIMAFALVATVPADGYAVQLALMDKPGSRMRNGSVLVTCYAVRFFSSGFSSFIHAFLMNGPDQNGDKVVAWDQAWAWGITFQTYFFIIITLLCIMFVPIVMMIEVEDARPEARRRSFFGLFRELWEIAKSKTVLCFLFYGFFIQMSQTGNSAAWLLQGTVIGVPIVQVGMESMLAFVARALGLLAFRAQLMHQNWRSISVFVRLFEIGTRAVLWCMAFYNLFGLQYGWFTVYINVTSLFLRGIVFMVLPVAIIEVSRPGMETTAYQMIIWVYNSSIDVSIQIRRPLFEWLIPDDLPLTTDEEFDANDGPWMFTRYTIILSVITMVSALIGCRFMPTGAKMVRDWNRALDEQWRFRYGLASLIISLSIATYSTMASLSVLFPDVLECSVLFGGNGCGATIEEI